MHLEPTGHPDSTFDSSFKKAEKKLKSKLENFNNLSEGHFSHRLGKEFPNIANELLSPRKDRKVGPLLLPDIRMS